MRVVTLFRYQVLEVLRNPLQIFMIGAVIGLGILWRFLLGGGEDLPMLIVTLLMAAYMVCWGVPLFSLLEDKEKRTLESVLLTPVRAEEVLLAKLSLAAAFTGLTVGGLMAVWQTAPAQPVVAIFGTVVVCLFTASGGALLGLLLKDLKTAGAVATPVMLILLFATMLPWETEAPAFWAVSAWLPTRPAMELLQAGWYGVGADVWRNAAVMLTYSAGLLWLCARQMRRVASQG